MESHQLVLICRITWQPLSVRALDTHVSSMWAIKKRRCRALKMAFRIHRHALDSNMAVQTWHKHFIGFWRNVHFRIRTVIHRDFRMPFCWNNWKKTSAMSIWWASCSTWLSSLSILTFCYLSGYLRTRGENIWARTIWQTEITVYHSGGWWMYCRTIRHIQYWIAKCDRCGKNGQSTKTIQPSARPGRLFRCRISAWN